MNWPPKMSKTTGQHDQENLFRDLLQNNDFFWLHIGLTNIKTFLVFHNYWFIILVR